MMLWQEGWETRPVSCCDVEGCTNGDIGWGYDISGESSGAGPLNRACVINDPMLAHSGNKVCRLHETPTVHDCWLQAPYPTTHVDGDVFYVGAWFKFENIPDYSWWRIFKLGITHSAPTGYAYLNMTQTSLGLSLLFNNAVNFDDNYTINGAIPSIQPNTWHLFEFMTREANDGGGYYRVWWDSALILNETGLNNVNPGTQVPCHGRFEIGLQLYEQYGDMTVLLDDINVADYRPSAVQHTLGINSTPINIPVTLDGQALNTPVSIPVDEGDHTISVPPQVEA